jgi:hypothetical protein
VRESLFVLGAKTGELVVGFTCACDNATSLGKKKKKIAHQRAGDEEEEQRREPEQSSPNAIAHVQEEDEEQ